MTEAIKYEVLDTIGHGSFGVIRKVRRKADGQILCRKEISYARMGDGERQQLHAEFAILSSLRHPNIVAYYHREHLKASQNLHLYMEFCGNGDLGRIIRNLKATNQYAEEEFVWSIFSQLVTALYRCHYGVDPPEVGRNVTVTGNSAKSVPVDGKKQVMILHRDLKPENVFLGEDNSVKLGDFGLSKILQSHDFASTYVGTPFYMSPEICASERYTLHSDIWSLGCIMYELCAREVPFLAKTHIQLVQKIKDGRYPPLPAVYSPELQAVIRRCLQVNPRDRPDTATLLNLPVVRLMRKEREVVEIGRALKAKEALAKKYMEEVKEKEAALQSDFAKRRQEYELGIRHEWELKAHAEIERRTQEKMSELSVLFEAEVGRRVQAEVEAQMQTFMAEQERVSKAAAAAAAASSSTSNNSSASSGSTSEESDSTAATDLSALSLESPEATTDKKFLKDTRTPLCRSRTMYVGSPMDVQMVDPSPIAHPRLSLFPRRHETSAGTLETHNIFAATAVTTAAAEPLVIDLTVSTDDREKGDVMPAPPSPSHGIRANGVAKAARPNLFTRHTAPPPRGAAQGIGNHNPPGVFANAADVRDTQRAVVPPAGFGGAQHAVVKREAVQEAKKPGPLLRRHSKQPPSPTAFANEAGSPVRKAGRPTTQIAPSRANVRAGGGNDMFKAVTKNNMMKGRTLVELAQARMSTEPATIQNVKQTEELKNAQATEIVWDPAKDEMPSPFLVRGVRTASR